MSLSEVSTFDAACNKITVDLLVTSCSVDQSVSTGCSAPEFAVSYTVSKVDGQTDRHPDTQSDPGEKMQSKHKTEVAQNSQQGYKRDKRDLKIGVEQIVIKCETSLQYIKLFVTLQCFYNIKVFVEIF